MGNCVASKPKRADAELAGGDPEILKNKAEDTTNVVVEDIDVEADAGAKNADQVLAQEPEKQKETKPSTFWLVDHTFKEGADSAAWWARMTEMMANPDAMKQFFAENVEAGCYNHAFMPLSLSHMFCVWEVSGERSEHDLRTLVDEKIGMGMLENTLLQVDTEKLGGGQRPFERCFAENSKVSKTEPKPPSATTSNWWLVKHDVVEGKADAWWAETAEIMGDQQKTEEFVKKNEEQGFFYHAFMPVSKDLAYCIWEGKTETNTDGLQGVLDENVGRGAWVNVPFPIPSAMTQGTAFYESHF